MQREDNNAIGNGSMMGLRNSPDRRAESAHTRKASHSRFSTNNMSEYGYGEVFRTFIVHFMGDSTYSFYNVE